MAIPEVAVGGVVANVILVVLATIIVSLRFYARKRSKVALQADDWLILFCLLFLFSAHPVASYWNTSPELIGTQFILDVPNLVIACAAVDIFLDIAVLSLPFPVIKGLHMPTEKKVYVSGVFLLGAFCLISSCIRLYYSQKLFGTSTPDLKLDEEVYLWAHIEAYASTITACLPCLAPLLSGGRSLGSIIGSVRSKLSIRSKNSSLFRKNSSGSNRLPSPLSEKSPWNDDGSGPTSIVTGGARDLESQRYPKYPEERILVEKSFASAAGSSVQ
ncbi:putative integral membrane protein pth11- protein [Botrytis cinerea BcDW1]|uniref:Putative integral membrane protein pth11-protein n=1 Tax=Botryotinia fuckeliana (strain BcDW1) TaxID=1290391 RepID=M7UIP3_BOTF1|nr:putative integral membrane protein pth11- protein [Botrytis cinerea BcDW1]